MPNKEYACTEEQFLNNVKDHSMKIIRDDGVHRHINFSRNNGSAYHFDLITWPGKLCISGDCGTYVFCRIEDMFEFFRTDKNDFNYNHNGLSINPGYWGEKLKSIGTNAGYKEFDQDEFEARVKEHFETFMAPEIDNEEAKSELWDQIEDQVLSKSCDGEHAAYSAVHDFYYEKIMFVDFFDGGSTKRYTFNYIWCLYAIVWGIKKYDEAKEKGVVAA